MSNTNFAAKNGAVLIEVADVPAGIALPDGDAYRFIAVDQRFRLLDGSRFKKPVQAEIAARNLLAAQDNEPNGGASRASRKSEPRAYQAA